MLYAASIRAAIWPHVLGIFSLSQVKELLFHETENFLWPRVDMSVFWGEKVTDSLCIIDLRWKKESR